MIRDEVDHCRASSRGDSRTDCQSTRLIAASIGRHRCVVDADGPIARHASRARRQRSIPHWPDLYKRNMCDGTAEAALGAEPAFSFHLRAWLRSVSNLYAGWTILAPSTPWPTPVRGAGGAGA
jgi:hypothetical protein